MKSFAFRPYLLLVWAAIIVFLSASATADWTAVVMIGILGTPVVLLLCRLWPKKWHLRHWLFRSVIVIPVAIGVIVSVGVTSWPMRASFLIVRPSLDTIAARIDRGENVSFPVRLGLVTLVAAEKRRGVVCLWTDSPNINPDGFVRATPKTIENHPAQTEGNGAWFNVWSVTPLDKDWTFYSED